MPPSCRPYKPEEILLVRWVLRRSVILIKNSGSACYPGVLTARVVVIAAVTREAELENPEAALCSEEGTDRIASRCLNWSSYFCCLNNKQTLPVYPLLEMNLACSSLQHSLFCWHLTSSNNNNRAHNLTDKSSTCVQKKKKKDTKNRNHKPIKFCSVKLNNALNLLNLCCPFLLWTLICGLCLVTVK